MSAWSRGLGLGLGNCQGAHWSAATSTKRLAPTSASKATGSVSRACAAACAPSRHGTSFTVHALLAQVAARVAGKLFGTASMKTRRQ